MKNRKDFEKLSITKLKELRSGIKTGKHAPKVGKRYYAFLTRLITKKRKR